jgi:hypothetical protein
MPRNQNHSRVLRGLERLVADGFLSPFAEWQNVRQLKEPPSILREADRCAALAVRDISL